MISKVIKTLGRLIGRESEYSVEHRMLNIVLLFGMLLSSWSALANYLLGLAPLLVLTCVLSTVFFACIYYLSKVRRRYAASIGVLLMVIAVITPILWMLNGGVSGSVPFYVILFSSVGAVLLPGWQRILIIAYFVAVSGGLIALEYYVPSLITGYSSETERLADIFVGIITIISFNAFIMAVIFQHYRKEHDKAMAYLAQKEKVQEHLLYISYHDALTGLYNRMYFEKEADETERNQECGVGVFVVDIDQLKFINDTFGHGEGDMALLRVAKVLQGSFRPFDTIARVGGDEFVVIVKNTTLQQMEALYKRLRKRSQDKIQQNEGFNFPVSTSVGYAYSAEGDKSVRELVKEADYKMYREKLHRKARTAGTAIQTVRKMLLERDYDTGVHSDRMDAMINDFALAAGLPESEMADIRLFAEFHDVGKIGVPDHILRKPGPLTSEEKKQIQQHCEIGYRIAAASIDLTPVADWILKHHEWWDGRGYPLGVGGEKIPLACRLLAIVDAYDAMTSDRPYRKALSHERALNELQKWAGSQFDPELMKIFIGLPAEMRENCG